VPYTGQTEKYELYVFVEYIEIKLVTLNLNRYDGFKQLVQTLTMDKTVEVEYKYNADGRGWRRYFKEIFKWIVVNE